MSEKVNEDLLSILPSDWNSRSESLTISKTCLAENARCVWEDDGKTKERSDVPFPLIEGDTVQVHRGEISKRSQVTILKTDGTAEVLREKVPATGPVVVAMQRGKVWFVGQVPGENLKNLSRSIEIMTGASTVPQPPTKKPDAAKRIGRKKGSKNRSTIIKEQLAEMETADHESLVDNKDYQDLKKELAEILTKREKKS